MKIEVPFNYINLMAFITLLKYENKKSIKTDTLQKYHQATLEEVINQHNDKSSVFYEENDEWSEQIEFYVNENDNLNNFLNKFSNLFYLNGDTIYLNDDVTYDELIETEVILRNEESISHRFGEASQSNKTFEVLGINKIKAVIEKFIKIEAELEKLYSKLGDFDNVETEKKIKKLLFMRAMFLNNICQNNDYILDAFRLESSRIHESNTSYEYSKLPIDLELWKQSEYFDEYDLADIDDRIYDMYQYAIFGKTGLATRKTEIMLGNLFFSGESMQDKEFRLVEEDYFFEGCSDDIDIDDDMIYYISGNEEIDLVFHLTYLDKLNTYMEKYGQSQNLIEMRNRLLYVLDMPELCLFKKDNFTQQLDDIKNSELEAEDFDFVEDEVRFMANEIFMTEADENTLKKLLFISTYYQLTKDSEIIDIIKNYSDHDMFGMYTEIIFGETKGYSKKLFKK